MGSKRLAGLRILVVEDEPLIAFDVALTLEDAGATVVGPASNIRRALEIIERENIDCGVLDVRLGNEHVGPAAAALHAKGCPFVFHTGHADPVVTEQWPDRPILRKPSSPDAIVAVLSSFLRTTC